MIETGIGEVPPTLPKGSVEGNKTLFRVALVRVTVSRSKIHSPHEAVSSGQPKQTPDECILSHKRDYVTPRWWSN